jgi:hypothetical protein
MIKASNVGLGNETLMPAYLSAKGIIFLMPDGKRTALKHVLLRCLIPCDRAEFALKKAKNLIIQNRLILRRKGVNGKISFSIFRQLMTQGFVYKHVLVE